MQIGGYFTKTHHEKHKKTNFLLKTANCKYSIL
uniref:Uncharacterized protein n=1 Tax=Myoviridae sp. ctBoB21 TaxID=2827287 RepID=A0A8S5R5H4_9CAUD|nr:MAG TPA: hypothetical protein [Myoviridae sp. ctBoB21]